MGLDKRCRYKIRETSEIYLFIKYPRSHIYYAKYHIENAKQYASRYDISGSVYEYQLALNLDPMNYEARKAYANILELKDLISNK